MLQGLKASSHVTSRVWGGAVGLPLKLARGREETPVLVYKLVQM